MSINKRRSPGFPCIFEQQKHIYSNSGDQSDNRKTFYNHYYHSTMLRYTKLGSMLFVNLYSTTELGVTYLRFKNTLDEYLPYLQANENKNTMSYQVTPLG
ncbi:MAG: hypothetical protein WC756_09190 [Taibaiella sp.]